MKKGGKHSQPRGFTMIEVLIVLAVTGALFVSAVALITGRQGQTEFDTAIHDMQSQIQQTITEVSNGYYPNLGNFTCTATVSGPSIMSGNTGQGSNTGCIFLGKAIQFGMPSTDPQQFDTYSIAALQKDGSGNDITSLADGKPTVIAPTSASPGTPNGIQTRIQQGGLTVQSMSYGTSRTPIGAVAFVNSLASYGSNGAIVSTSEHVDVVPVAGSAIGSSTVAAADTINSKLVGSPVDPDGGVFICFASGTTNQSGLVTIGSNGRQLSVTLDVKDGKTCGQ